MGGLYEYDGSFLANARHLQFLCGEMTGNVIICIFAGQI